MKSLACLIFVLFIAFSTYSQEIHLKYDVVMNCHNLPDDLPLVDSIYNEEGNLYVSDSVINIYPCDKKLIKHEISYKVLDLDCRCYYYFNENRYVIVVNLVKGFVLIGKINQKVVYTSTYYLKTD